MGSRDSNVVLVAGNCPDQIAGVVAVAVCGPDRVLAVSGILPGHVIAARCLYRADRRPGAKLAARHVGALIFQRGTRSISAIEVICG